MKEFHHLLRVLLVAIVCANSPAMAQRGHPASLLLYPEYHAGLGTIHLTTVTNIDDTPGAEIDVHYTYVNGGNCSEFHKTETLKSLDTLTVLSLTHTPLGDEGYLYVYAENANQQAVVHNRLIGTSSVFSAFDNMAYTVEPFSFRAIGSTGSLTDVDQDGRRDLNGVEYAHVGDQYLFPRFFAQSPIFSGDMILIDLTGGAGFETKARFWIHNDRGDDFSADVHFQCWTKAPLSSMTTLMSQSFLESTNHDPNEILGMSVFESGWLRVDGDVTYDLAQTIPDPAIVALLVETTSIRQASTHPAFQGVQGNASLTPGGSSSLNGGAE